MVHELWLVQWQAAAILILTRPVLRLSSGFMGLLGWRAESCWHGVLFIAWLGWWRAVSRLTCVVASHAVLTWRAGEGGGLILPALAKSAPTLPSPPRHPGTARCAACGVGDRNAGCFCPRIPVQAHTGSHGQGVSRSDNLCSQCAEDGSPLVRAQSEVASLQKRQTAHNSGSQHDRHTAPPPPNPSDQAAAPAPTITPMAPAAPAARL